MGEAGEPHESAGRPLLRRPEPEPPLLPVPDEARDLIPTLLPRKGRAIPDKPHDLRVVAEPGVGLQILIPPPAQQEPLRLDLNQP